MIEEIRIENVGVIAQAHLALAPSLTVITGETGAGKTMVLTGLGLLLGARADPAVVRPGAARAVVEGLVTKPSPEVRSRAEDLGAQLDDDSLLLVRAVPADGRSRAWIGGRAVPHAVLAELGAELVTVHGQTDQLRLRVPSEQRSALDDFAGSEHRATLARYREAYAERATAQEALAAWEDDAAAREEELRALSAGLAAVEALDPQPGEDLALKEEADRLSHVEELRSAARSAHAALSGLPSRSPGGDVAGFEEPGGSGPGAAESVRQARRDLEQAARLDPSLAAWSEQLTEVAYVLDDVVVELSSYVTGLEADPARLAAVHERRAALTELARRYAGSTSPGHPNPGAAGGADELRTWAQRARTRLAELGDPGHTRETLAGRLAEAEATLRTLAADVTRGRERAAAALATAVEAELAVLAMPGARLQVRLATRPEPGPWGAQDVEILLSGHPGAPARPLSRGASGGELSRVMLALEVALATAPGASPPPTFVFDEVDAGVGGRAALEVGRRLAELGRSAQVVVVTHLAQVAAFADRHLVVTKTTRGGQDVVTDSGVRTVEGRERVRELARMLSGHQESEAALRHAEELLARAAVGA